MRHPVLIALLVALAACANPQICPAGTTEMELGGCCPDANADGACDPPQAQEGNATPQQPTNAANETNDTVPAEPEEPEVISVGPGPQINETASQAEQYLALADYAVDTFTYFTDSEYGEVWVWYEPNVTAYIATQNLFQTRDGVVSRSQYDYQRDDEAFVNGIEDRALAVMNYIWYKNGKYTGCYVEEVFYREENCIPDFPNKNPVIWYDLSFNPPESPLDWLRARIGQEPLSRSEGRTYRDPGGGQWLVDELTFQNQDGTTERLYVAQGYGVPLRREILDASGRVRRTYALESPAFNRLNRPDGRMLPASRANT